MDQNTPGTPLSFRKTRLAPTPSGYLHLGNIFSFALTAALAEKYRAKILLRIDDLDRLRAQPEYIHDIFDTLTFMEIPWQEGPRNVQEFEQRWSQRHRLDRYGQALRQLRDQGMLYACDCSRTQILQADPSGTYPGRCRDRGLSLDTPDVNWRLRTTADSMLIVRTPDQPITTTLPVDQHDFVVRKKDGFPAYQLTSLIDDVHFGVDFIVRGTDLWPSTLAQQYLAGVLGLASFQRATFYHHALLTLAGRKLSKSAGDTSIQHLRKAGQTCQDIYQLIGEQAGMKMPIKDWKTLMNAGRA